MQYYFAPLEGLTGYLYRNLHAAYFSKADRYYTPFLTPNQNHRFSSREKNDVLPQNNMDMPVIPQVLTNDAEHFLWAAQELSAMGYSEINLNLGCPSGTVVAKNKGSGLLKDPMVLDRFLDAIFSACSIRISVKTRLGLTDPSEFSELLTCFQRYPICELIIHPRVQTDFYKAPVNISAFTDYYAQCSARICYNGDLFTAAAAEEFHAQFPDVPAMMFGRGALANPGLFGECRGQARMDLHTLREFHDALFAAYQQTLFGDKPVLHKMKELWFYMHGSVTNGARYLKKIRKATRLSDYQSIIVQMFSCESIAPDAAYQIG